VATKSKPNSDEFLPTQELTDLHRWQISEIEEGIKEADQGRFANPKKVNAFFEKWTKTFK